MKPSPSKPSLHLQKESAVPLDKHTPSSEHFPEHKPK